MRFVYGMVALGLVCLVFLAGFYYAKNQTGDVYSVMWVLTESGQVRVGGCNFRLTCDDPLAAILISNRDDSMYYRFEVFDVHDRWWVEAEEPDGDYVYYHGGVVYYKSDTRIRTSIGNWFVVPYGETFETITVENILGQEFWLKLVKAGTLDECMS